MRRATTTRSTPPKRQATDDQLRFLSHLCDEGILKAFRAYVEHPRAKEARQLMLRLDDESWGEITQECGRAALDFAVRTRNPERAGLNVTLSHNLAKAFVKTVRTRSLAEQKKRRRVEGPGPLQQLYLLLDDLGFQNYREGLLVLADRILRLYREPASQCLECRGCRLKEQTCPKCRRAMCPVHCQCAYEKDGSWRRAGHHRTNN